jgi:hypothetical protein
MSFIENEYETRTYFQAIKTGDKCVNMWEAPLLTNVMSPLCLGPHIEAPFLRG